MVVGAWWGLRAWLAEIDRQLAFMRPSTLNSGRFDATEHLLTAERLRGSSDVDALSEVGVRLCDARQAMGRHSMT